MDDEALKLALEALEANPLEMVEDANGHMIFLKDKAIAAIKEALAQPEQEPVAWWNDMSGVIDLNVSGRGKPLYTAPSQPTQELVAYVMGTHGGRFVVAPLNPAMVLPVGMALYAGPA